MSASLDVTRPRNLDWKRAAALLYGDWGTSKAYVLGLAFAAVGFASFHTILAVCVLTGMVGINYAIVCRYFPDGGGVYSAAKAHGRMLAVIGALLLVADLTVTAALSGLDALHYLFADAIPVAWMPWVAMIFVIGFGFLNSYGPRHSGGLAVALAIPTVIVVLAIILLAAPHLTTQYLAKPTGSTGDAWMSFVRTILALSGVEAIASLTGVLKLDPGSTPEKPSVARESRRSIFPVALEVTIGTALLGWAMLSIPTEFRAELDLHHEDMLRYVARYFGTATVGPVFGTWFGWGASIVIGLLLLSAVNTAIAALIGMLYTLARDGEMPRNFLILNRHGVPRLPLYAATVMPIAVLMLTIPNPANALHTLADLYAIGVVGAITVNLGSCAFNKALPLRAWERGLFLLTFTILFAVELTLAYDKHLALFFVVIVLGVGLWLRALSHKASGLATVTIAREVAEAVTPEAIELLRPPPLVEGRKILVAARGATPVLRFALNEAKLHKAVLCVLYVKEIAVLLGGNERINGKRPRWQDDPQAAGIMSLILKLADDLGVCVQPIYAVSTDPAGTIVDVAATLGVDIVMLGSTQRVNMARLLKGNIAERVASHLPENIEFIIYG